LFFTSLNTSLSSILKEVKVLLELLHQDDLDCAENLALNLEATG
jgi:hypothetical protein